MKTLCTNNYATKQNKNKKQNADRYLQYIFHYWETLFGNNYVTKQNKNQKLNNDRHLK